MIPVLIGVLMLAQTYFVASYGSIRDFYAERGFLRTFMMCAKPLEHLAAIAAALSNRVRCGGSYSTFGWASFSGAT